MSSRFLLVVLALAACKIRRLDPLPPERDPSAAEAPMTDYEAPPDVLTTELGSPAADDAADPHAGHHGHHATPPAASEPAKAPAPNEPKPVEPKPVEPKEDAHDHHGGAP